MGLKNRMKLHCFSCENECNIPSKINDALKGVKLSEIMQLIAALCEEN